MVLVYVLARSASDGMGCGAHEGSLGLDAAAEPCEDCTGRSISGRMDEEVGDWGGVGSQQVVAHFKTSAYSTFSSCDAG